MIEKYTLDQFTEKTVSVKYKKFGEETEEQIGKPHRTAYVNSERGRQKVENELPSPQQDAIFQVWGDEPTVTEED